MSQQSKTTLKTYFNTGDTPTEAQFIDLIDSFQDASAAAPTLRTGSTVLFDKQLSGAAYNTVTPSSSATLTLDFTEAVAGACVQFKNNGTQITSFVNGAAIVWGNVQRVGTAASLFLYYDGTDVYANWLPGNASTQLTTPTLAVIPGNTEIDYTLSAIDANATGGVFTIDTNSDFSTETPVSGWTFGTTTGTITGLTNGTLYYLRFKNTSAGYVTSAYATASTTPAVLAFTLVNITKSGTVYTAGVSSFAAYGYSAQPIVGDFEFIADLPNAAGLNVLLGISTGPTIGAYNASPYYNFWGFISSSSPGQIVKGTPLGSGVTLSGSYATSGAGKTLKIKRVGTTCTLEHNGTVYDTQTVSASPMYLHISASDAAKTINDPRVV